MTKVYMATKSDLEQVKVAFNANDTTNVGYITWQMCLMRNYLKLNGMPLVNASIDYADLLQFAVDHELITTDTADKALFKYDETEDVLTLPDYMNLCLQGGTMVKTEQAGLPNITGTFGCSDDGDTGSMYVYTDDTTGAFDYTQVEKGSFFVTNGSNTGRNVIDFDASRSSTVYGASSTVQPPAIKLIPQVKYRRGADGQVNSDGTPLGTIIMFMGTVAPADYLFCDGTLYDIADYPKFATFITTQFGIVNYFGGDGETTFAVPDLRGEFLRCTGKNGHEKQGHGADVGVHQDSTEINSVFAAHVNNIYAYKSESTSNALIKKYDSVIATTNYQNRVQTIEEQYSSDGPSIYTSRPTNTSVMYCIKVKTGDEQ